MFITKKKDGMLKARTCANRSIQRDYLGKESTLSPTVVTERILITGTIEAKQKRVVVTADVPNAFVQTDIPSKGKGERVMMKIKGLLVQVLREISHKTYARFVRYEHNQPTIYVPILKALSRIIVSA